MPSPSVDKRARIGIMYSDKWFLPHPAMQKGIALSAKTLKSAGYEVVDFTFPFESDEVAPIIATLLTRDEWLFMHNTMEKNMNNALKLP